MNTILPPSRLLPATIAATAIVLAIKAVSLVTFAPSPNAVWTETTQALMRAGTAKMVSRAHAAGVAAPPPSLPQSASASVEPVPPAAPPKSEYPQSTDARQASPNEVLDVGAHRSQVEERELRVTQREATLAATDKRLAERIAELTAIESRLEALDSGLKERDNANWSGLVKLYEGMRPREAASIFNSLEKPVLLEILDRMKPAKAAPVIASMEAEKARQVTADLATKRTRSTTVTN
jgi:flagellar motility protein MotE (MotC chaperone)